MKRIHIILILCLLVFIVNGCDLQNQDNKKMDSVENGANYADENAEEESIDDSQITDRGDASSDLAKSCDVILASGKYKDDYYELVANEKEDYDGTKTEIGVIKNGKWSVNLTSKNCFIEDGGLLVDEESVIDNDHFKYIGHGCFYYQNIIFNADKNLSYLGSPYADEGFFAVFSAGIRTDFDYYENLMSTVERNHNEELDADTIINDEGIFLFFNGSSFYLIDSNTMKKTEIKLTVPGEGYNCTVYPYSENLIGIRSVFSGGISNSDSDGFYDVNGKRVIDLSKYDTDTSDPIGFYFINGESTFEINNDQDKRYFITINKAGKVIKSEKIEDYDD